MSPAADPATTVQNTIGAIDHPDHTSQRSPRGFIGLRSEGDNPERP